MLVCVFVNMNVSVVIGWVSGGFCVCLSSKECMFVYIHIVVHMCVDIFIYAFIFGYICVLIYLYTCIYVYVYMLE